MNRVLLVGRIANDITYNRTANNISFARANLAISRRGTEQTDFIPIVGWRATADLMNNILSKGVLVSVEGTLFSSSYQNNEGKIVRSLDVHIDRILVLESKAAVQSRNINHQNPSNYQQNPNYKNNNNNYNSNNYANNEPNTYPDYTSYSGPIKKSQNPTFGENKSQKNTGSDDENSTTWDYDMSNIDTLD